jgi:hypothetical protein
MAKIRQALASDNPASCYVVLESVDDPLPDWAGSGPIKAYIRVPATADSPGFNGPEDWDEQPVGGQEHE